MKKHLFFEIIAAFLLVARPVLAGFDGGRTFTPFPPHLVLFHAAMSALMILRCKSLGEGDGGSPPAPMAAWEKLAWSALLLAGLTANSALWGTLADLSGFSVRTEFLPGPLSGWPLFANILLGTAGAALYEEVVYRLYAPKLLMAAVLRKEDTARSPRALPKALLEGAMVVMFALGHRHGGWPSVLNALVAGAALRLFIKRTGSLACAAAVHAAFNLMQLARLAS